jgi:hypothetical protein
MRSRSVWAAALLALTVTGAQATADTKPVIDENLRMAALRAVFPQMKIARWAAKRIALSLPKRNSPSNWPEASDALTKEPIYQVSGKGMNEIERCASEHMGLETFSQDREVRLRLFRWPGRAETELVVLVQYEFLNAAPAGSCSSIPMLAHLVASGATWLVRDQYLLDTTHHSSVHRVELLDIDGSGIPALIVESDFGGGGTSGATLQVFDLRAKTFNQILKTVSRLYGDEATYTQVLNVARTRAAHAKRFHITKTAYAGNGTWFPKPRVSHPIYERGFGVDDDYKARQLFLGPPE